MVQFKLYKIAGSHIIHENFDDETVIINLETGNYYNLNETGNLIWSMVTSLEIHEQNPKDLSEIDVLGFLRKLLEEGLIVRDSSAGSVEKEDSQSPPQAEGTSKKKNGGPEITKYTDMQDLLLLDPIHEVDDMGWPKKPDDQG